MRTHKNSWLDVFSTFRIALDLKKMALGALGVYITFILIGVLFYVSAQIWEAGAPGAPPEPIIGVHRPREAAPEPVEERPWDVEMEQEMIRKAPPPMPEILDIVKDPWKELPDVGKVVRHRLSPIGGNVCDFFNWSCGATGPIQYGKIGFLAGAGVLLLLVWSFFGGGIARLAAVDAAKGERPSIGEAMAFASKKYGSFFWSPVVPFIFVVIFLLCNALLGLVGRVPYAGPILVGIFFVLALLSGFIVLMLLLGGIFGCMFMWPTVAMEGTDAFDAISRGFNYLFARPWKVLWCSLVSIAYGIVCVGFVGGFTWVLLRLSTAGVAWGMGEKFGRIGQLLSDWNLAGMTVSDGIAGVLILILFILAAGLMFGFIVSFKLSAMTVIYNILRHDVDGTDMSEVYLPEAEEETPEAPLEEPAPEAAAEPPKEETPPEAPAAEEEPKSEDAGESKEQS